jgi:hypothetical protein
MWTIVTVAFCAGLAAIALLRGLAGLVVGRAWLGRLEAVALLFAGLVGWLVLALSRHVPG